MLKIPCRKFNGFAVVAAKSIGNVNAGSKRNGADIQLNGKAVYAVNKLLLYHIAVYINNHKSKAAPAVFKLKGSLDYSVGGILAYKHLPFAANSCGVTKVLYPSVINGITFIKVSFAVAGTNGIKGSITLVGRVFSKIVVTAVSLSRRR